MDHTDVNAYLDTAQDDPEDINEAPWRHPEGPFHSRLHKAEKILRSGQPLPLDMAARLMDEGIDVDGLERLYP